MEKALREQYRMKGVKAKHHLFQRAEVRRVIKASGKRPGAAGWLEPLEEPLGGS